MTIRQTLGSTCTGWTGDERQGERPVLKSVLRHTVTLKGRGGLGTVAHPVLLFIQEAEANI